MRLCLINPANSLALADKRRKWSKRYRVWKPLGLLTVAAMTPPGWDVSVIDENQDIPDYHAMPQPDFVGITAFTSQACRAYELAGQFRAMGVPVVMGGIHASMRPDEALEHVDSIVIGEAEGIWPRVLDDFQAGGLARRYEAEAARSEMIRGARHDLLPGDYALGAIQTTRGCPLNCSFCSVTAFNGAQYRHRPIADVVEELRTVREKLVLVVDDNLIGTNNAHIARAKRLFSAMIDAKLHKQWIGQVTINMGDDDELLDLAARAGCVGVFIGFESPTVEGLAEVGKKFNLSKGRDLRASVQRIQRHGILVVGSFIIGLDADRPGIGRQIADAGARYGVDILNALFLTPLPGTQLWDRMTSEGRVSACQFPEDWRYYTLTFPVARYAQLTRAQVVREMEECDRAFYSPAGMARRIWSSVRHWRHPLISLIGNLTYRGSLRANHTAYRAFIRAQGRSIAADFSAASASADFGLSSLGGLTTTQSRLTLGR